MRYRLIHRHLRGSISYGALLVAMPRMSPSDLGNVMAAAYRGLGLDHLTMSVPFFFGRNHMKRVAQ